MAVKATVFRAQLQVADMDRQHYGDYALTIAQHPSETDQRMMVRLLAFALHAHDRLEFGKGVSTAEEPDLWQTDLTGAIETWIELGQPDEKRLRQACARAARVYVYTYSGHAAQLWWEQNGTALGRLDRLAVRHLPAETPGELAKLAQRNMQLHCTIQDDQAWLSDGLHSVAVAPVAVKYAT